MAATKSRSGKGRRNLTSDSLLERLTRSFFEVLSIIGKPFFVAISYIILFILFFIFGAKRLFKTFFQNAFLTKERRKFIFKKHFNIYIADKLLFLKKFPIKKVDFPKIFKAHYSLISLGIFFTIFTLSSLSIITLAIILQDLPSPRTLMERKVEASTKIYDRNGVLLYKIYKNKNRTPVPLNQIPLHVRLATLAAEDAEFYNHAGFSIKGMLRSMVRNTTRGELTGGSTITQQLVKNALLSPEKTITRKLREIILSIGVELTFTKDEILEMYLNEVSYGGTAYGIEEASLSYFAKSSKDLTLAEAAFLAGLPKSPTRFSPFGSNPDLAVSRQKEILRLMAVNRFISKDEELRTKDEKLEFSTEKIDIKAPHFVMYVRSLLVEKYGEEMVEKGGLEVTTTIDYKIQEKAEEIVKRNVEKIAALRVSNGAALILDSQSGEILAMVGSKDYFDQKGDGNFNVTTAFRQPGSSIKIVNYAYALSNGFTPASLISDSPVSFSIPGQPVYSPKNYDGGYRGVITLRSALAESRNIPAVKVLASYGVDKMIDLGKEMGITSWEERERFGLSLTLGGGEVKLIDLAGVYTTIANYGRQTKPKAILKVTDYKGEIVEKNNCPSENQDDSEQNCIQKEVLSPQVSYLLIDILKDNKARSPAFGINSQLVIPGRDDVAVKTGTSNDLKDNLAIGFNQKYLVATWVGNNDGSPMSRVASGVTGASPIWNEIMRNLLKDEPNHPWPIPEGIVELPICSLTGTLTCDGCPTYKEWFLEENKPAGKCNLLPLVEEVNQENNGNVLPEKDRLEKLREKLKKLRNRN